MKPFIHEDFLLENSIAKRLYHNFAEEQPVIDFHCHLPVKMIAGEHRFDNIGEAWLDGDHYKWRAMRENGIREYFCTGNGTFPEKFRNWSSIVPRLAGNPLYHWTHLELLRYFGIQDLLSSSNADEVYTVASELLRTPEYSTRNLLRKMNVQVVCTTDDPVDSLEYHRSLSGDFEIRVLPTFRPDQVLRVNEPAAFRAYLEKLEEASKTGIYSYADLINALESRHSFFHENGCRLSDHGLERFYFSDVSPLDPERIFKTIMEGIVPGPEEIEKFRTGVMIELCRMNHKRGWTQQFHVGAIRNNNQRMFRATGPDAGWDSIGALQDTRKMSLFLNALDDTDQLARTILYNLNPSDNEMMITMGANFNDGSTVGKVRYGAAWWFLDQKTGMEKNLQDLSLFGTLRNFIGMVTDSRSFLSYPRHEYFRRIACNFIGGEVVKGLIPDDDSLLEPLVRAITFSNANDYFKFNER